LSADGSFVYTPGVVYSGRDFFSYVVSDGRSLSSPATVTIEVAAPRDVTAPFVGLAGGDERALRVLIPARGVAVDVYALRESGIVVSSGLRSVVVHLQGPDGRYWNGRAYQVAPFNLPIVLQGRSFFVQPSSLPSRSQTPEGRYTWTAIATDNAGNIARAQQIIQLDLTSPTLRLTSPEAGTGITRVSSLSRVSGQAGGASRVEVALRRADGQYWNGQSYQRELFFLNTTPETSREASSAASGDNTWSLESGLPTGASLPLGRYTIIVRARDEVGNSTTTSRQILLSSIAAS
jgi:hypothetical protein